MFYNKYRNPLLADPNPWLLAHGKKVAFLSPGWASLREIATLLEIGPGSKRYKKYRFF